MALAATLLLPAPFANREIKMQTRIDELGNPADFYVAVERLKRIEGRGWDMLDRGGETIHGIVKKWHGSKFHEWPPPWSVYSRVRERTDARKTRKYNSARMFYYNEYWLAMKCDDFEHPMAEQLFLFAVNASKIQARRELQRAVSACRMVQNGRLVIDGRMGPNTRHSLQQCTPASLLAAFAASVEGFYRSAQQADRYAKGWIKKRIYFRR